MRARYFYFLIFVQLISTVAFAQDQRLKFQFLEAEHGLSQSTVFCILQDSKGFMWFGTGDGLNKYDGYKFTVYKNNPEDDNSISHNVINDILEDENGNLWIATWGGLNMFDVERGIFVRYKRGEKNKGSIKSLPTDLINCLLQDDQGNLWLGTEGEGLVMFDKKKHTFTKYVHDKARPSSINDNFIRDLLIDSKGNFWVGTVNGGLHLFNEERETFKQFTYKEEDSRSLSHPTVWSIFEDSKNRLWIGTFGGGVNLFERETGNFRHFKHQEGIENSLSRDIVNRIAEDQNGDIWIGTENGGLSVLDPETQKFSNYKQDDIDKNSLNNNTIYAIYKDRKGNMWLGTFAGGINFYNIDSRKFLHYRHSLSPASLSHNNVLSIYEDKKGDIWIGTDGGGLNLLNPEKETFKTYVHDPDSEKSICGNYVLNVLQDSKGDYWVSSWGDGITVFKPENEQYRHYKNDPDDATSLSFNSVWVIMEDSDKNIWLGTYGNGLDYYDRKTDTFKNYSVDKNNPNSLNNNKIFTVFEDSKNNLWIGTNGGGLNLFDRDKEQFTHFVHNNSENSISNNTINHIFEDSLGNFWIGTNGGLNYWDRTSNKFKVYTTKDGLPNDVVFGILEDNGGNLWLSTYNGLSEFDPTTGVFKNYSVTDGLQGYEFKRQAFCKSKSGKMYFGGINGFNEFFPDSVKDIPYDPPIVLTDFKIFNNQVSIAKDENDLSPLKKVISETDEITLSHDQNEVTIEFASLNYTDKKKKQYTYMLENFDDDWRDEGNTQTATYKNLDPGNYLFKVKGLDNTGNWSDKITTVAINIKPPFWDTLWFRLPILFLVAAILYFIYQVRIMSIEKQKKLLEWQVSERTIKMSAQNNQLKKQQEELESQRNALALQNKTIEEKSNQLQDQHVHLESLVESRTMELLKMNEELTDKNNRFEQYGFVTSHNFRGPVATLLGLAEIFNRKDLQDPINIYVIDKTKEITSKIDQMIKDLSTLLYKEDKLGSLYQAVSLEQVLANVKILLYDEIKKSKATISFDFAEFPIIETVPAYINSILYNLVSNSLKFKKEEESLKVNISSFSENGCHIIQITDNGMGIDIKKNGHLVFSPFKRFTTHVAGKGLGLYLVKSQMEALNGEVEMESEPGKGTSFKLIFNKN